MEQKAFTEEELYDLWSKFKDADDASIILSDFMNATKEEAEVLIDKFELRYQCRALDYDSRGKPGRVKTHI